MKFVFLTLILQTLLCYGQESCFEDFAFKDKFNFFEVRSNKPVSINSYYRESLLKTYTNLIEYADDKRFSYPSRNRDFVLVHMTDSEFESTLESLKNLGSTNHALDYHANLKQIKYRMYVNYDLNKKCNKDFIFIRDVNYVDRNFLHQIAHELFHILREQNCGSCTNKLWLEEGLAEYVASKTSGIRPNIALGYFLNLTEPISFFETNPDLYGVSHYGQSYLFLDFIFRQDFYKPHDILNSGFLKQFIKSGETSCEIIRDFFDVQVYSDIDLKQLPCEAWFVYAYKEFIYSLIDPNVARGGPTVNLVGNFAPSGTLPAKFSFALFDITSKLKSNATVLVQSSNILDIEYLFQAKSGESYFIPQKHFEVALKEIDFVSVKLLLVNYSNQDAQYRVDYKEQNVPIP